MENFVILFIVALLCVCSCSCSLLDSLGKGVPPPVLKPKTLNGVPTVSDTPAWANWTWESWLYGPPCPQDYRDVPPVQLQSDGPVANSLKEISFLLKLLVSRRNSKPNFTCFRLLSMKNFMGGNSA